MPITQQLLLGEEGRAGGSVRGERSGQGPWRLTQPRGLALAQPRALGSPRWAQGAAPKGWGEGSLGCVMLSAVLLGAALCRVPAALCAGASRA